MSKALVISDDGLGSEIAWDFGGLDFDVTKVSLSEDQSGKGSYLEIAGRPFFVKEFSKGLYVTDLHPVNAADWANQCLGPFDLAVIGPNRGLNIGDKCILSSSGVAMGKVLAHYGVRIIVVSMEDTGKDKFSTLGSKRLCGMINQFYGHIDPSYLLSMNFVCGDPAFAKYHTIKSLPDEQNAMFYTKYSNKDGEWYFENKRIPLKGYRNGTVVFSLIPLY